MKNKTIGIFVISILMFSTLIYFSQNSSGSIQSSEFSGKNNEDLSETSLKQSHASFPYYSLDELKNKSVLIIEGTPLEVIDEYFEAGNIPLTDFKFEVDKVFKGDESLVNSSILITQDGNSMDEFINHPLLRKNEKYLLFIREASEGDLVILGGPNGKFHFNYKNNLYESNTESVNMNELANVSLR